MPAPPPEASLAAAVRELAAAATTILRAAMFGTDPALAVSAADAVTRLTVGYLRHRDAQLTLETLADLADGFAPRLPADHTPARPAAVFGVADRSLGPLSAGPRRQRRRTAPRHRGYVRTYGSPDAPAARAGQPWEQSYF